MTLGQYCDDSGNCYEYDLEVMPPIQITPGPGGGEAVLNYPWFTGGKPAPSPGGGPTLAPGAGGAGSVDLSFPWFTGGAGPPPASPGGGVAMSPFYPGGGPAGGGGGVVDELSAFIQERSAVVWLGLGALLLLSFMKGKR